MCEVVILLILISRLGENCRRAGLKGFPYQAMLVGCWIGGEILGVVLGIGLMALIGAFLGPEWEPISFVVLVACIVTSLFFAARIPFQIVARHARTARDDAVQWTCGQCAEPVSLRESVCPMCGAARGPDPLFSEVVDTNRPATDASDFGFLDQGPGENR